LNAARVAQIHQFLNGFEVVVILIRRIVAEDVHVEAGALLDHGQPDASGADDRYCLAGDFVAEKWEIRMPEAPRVLACEMLGSPHPAREVTHYEKSELGGGFSKNLSRIGKWNVVTVSVSTIDVVEPDSVLRHYFQMSLARFEDLGVDGIAKGGNETIDSGFNFVDDQALRWSLGVGIEFDFVASLAKQVEGGADIGGGGNAEFIGHYFLSLVSL